jgi:hypothetical protein
VRAPRRGLRALPAVLLVLAGATSLPAVPAQAASSQESWFQDDNSLIFNTPQGTAQTLDTLKALGVDRIRVSVFWATVAPEAGSRTRPDFDATDPAQYPAGSWDRYDQVVRLAHDRGIAVNFDITAPAPLWATAGDPPRPDIANTWKPDPHEFSLFVQAVGTRYSGTYGGPQAAARSTAAASERATVLAAGPPPLCLLLGTCPPAGAPRQPPPATPVPRVDSFSIWNEPNQPGWLTPQWAPRADGTAVNTAPALYRGLVDAGWQGLQASGHGGDTILIGETAPKGLNTTTTTSATKALQFVRRLYCVDDALQPLRGADASDFGCPTDDAGTAAFAAAHPGLFGASGYGHHPYELASAPSRKPTDADFVTISSLDRLSTTFDRVFSLYGVQRPGLPLYLTEYGFNTDPPNPAGVSPNEQAAFLNQAEWMARRNADVRALTQFLLVDDTRRQRADGAGYAASFQTGLRYADGRDKPSLKAYELSFYVPTRKVKKGHRMRVWALVRPGRTLGPQRVRVQLRRGGRGRYRTIATVTSRRGTGLVDRRLRVPASGTLRVTWRDPRVKHTVVSRTIRVTVRRR